MATPEFTCLWQVQEPEETYQAQETLLLTKHVKVMAASYPPLKSNYGLGIWRRIPWINLRGYWLEQAGFTIGTTYTITVYDKQLIFTVD